MRSTKNCLVVVIAAVFLFSCRDPYNPKIESSNQSLLVVEGLLNTKGATFIRLSRSLRLNDTGRVKPELNATLTVEGKDNTTQSLLPQGNGIYASPSLNLILNNEYRLRIKTSNGKEYLSNYIVARQTPAIDSVGWNRDDDGIMLYVNTHDDANKTRYYRWEYEETWEIRSTYLSNYKYVGNGVVVPRGPNENVYTCWKYENFSSIILGSSARLQSDVIYQAPLTFIPKSSEKISVRYSILVRQFSLDKSGYEFYEMMKKMTENIGTVFDPQPTEIRGNIKCVSDTTELVIGYLTVASFNEKRIFITRTEVPGWGFIMDCPDIIVPNKKDTLDAFFGSGQYSPYEAVRNLNMQITGYSSSYPYCVDCTTRGGSTTRPSYW